MTISPLAFIIEDDRKSALIFSQALKSADFETVILYNGRQALEQLENLTPVVVLLDLYLPEVQGDQIARYIKSNIRFKKTQVIVTTSDPTMAGIIGEDADLVLIKPVSFQQLLDLSTRLRARIKV